MNATCTSTHPRTRIRTLDRVLTATFTAHLVALCAAGGVLTVLTVAHPVP